MGKLIKLLTLINNYYKKFLYMVMPLIIILMNFFDLLFLSFNKGSLYVMANVCIIITLLLLLTRYLHYRKNDLFCLCGTIAISYISIIMFISKRIELNFIVTIPLVGVFLIALIITLIVRFYDFYHNGK